jgi:hypothetical protein
MATTEDLCFGLGYSFSTTCWMMKAEKICLQVPASDEHSSPDEQSTNSQSLKAMKHLGWIYESQDDFQVAESWLLRAYTGYSKQYGPEHSAAQYCLHSLAVRMSMTKRQKSVPYSEVPEASIFSADAMPIVAVTEDTTCRRKGEPMEIIIPTYQNSRTVAFEACTEQDPEFTLDVIESGAEWSGRCHGRA